MHRTKYQVLKIWLRIIHYHFLSLLIFITEQEFMFSIIDFWVYEERIHKLNNKVELVKYGYLIEFTKEA